MDENVIVYENEDAGQGEAHYWSIHTLGDLLTACLEHDLALVHFAESPDNISSEEFEIYAERDAPLPLSYRLTARLNSGTVVASNTSR